MLVEDVGLIQVIGILTLCDNIQGFLKVRQSIRFKAAPLGQKCASGFFQELFKKTTDFWYSSDILNWTLRNKSPVDFEKCLELV